HPLALLIDIEHHAGDLVALLHDLVGVADLAHPAHVADVQQAVDSFLDLNERSIVREVPYSSGNDGPRGVALSNLIPWIGLNLLHPQRDFLLLAIDVQDLHFNLIADLHEFGGMIDASRPAHLANMDEPFDAWFQLHEGAVGHDVDHFALVAAGDRVLALHTLPGARRLVLQRQGDLFLLAIDRQDVNLQLLVDLDDVVRVGDAAPGHVGDVQQAIDPAEI